MARRLRLPATSPRDEARMTLIEHLGELRSRIIRVAIAFFAVAIVAWFFRIQIFEALLDPAPALEGRLSFTSVTAPIITDIKLTLYAAFLLTVPIFLYQAWAFVAPAVGEVGRVFTYVLIALASSLFLLGVAFGYFVVLPIGIDFLLSWDSDRYEEIVTADTYLGFVTRFLLAFGIVFEFPAATYVGAKLGLVTAPFLKSYRRHAIVVNFILAAALTPGQDPFSMILMAIPMVVMYEASILIARHVNPVVSHEEALEASPLSDRLPNDEEEDGETRDDGEERDL
jgi:sec-independent protein translocase protein TatC